MNTFTTALSQGIESNKAYQVGYEIGYFVGSNFWEVVIAAVLILAAILYFAFFRKRKKGLNNSPF
ncbi:hypothetical protein [Salinimicrobium xinjiangense]|uniref:hypothetical protein n=1 Tax=Salinimicrobium xinjiangense TaxID=438596 RepID=UPI0003F52474|nr:hypothetical protein [Salinimicrobium xinjiangense]